MPLREDCVVLLITLILLSGHSHRTTAQQVCNNIKTEEGNDLQKNSDCMNSLQILVMLPLHTQPFQRIASEEKMKSSTTHKSLLPSWDRGLEILPAAYAAANQINRLQNSLPGIKLEIVAVNSSLCGEARGSDSATLIVSFMRAVLNKKQAGRNIIGVTGLFCEASTSLISSVTHKADIHLL